VSRRRTGNAGFDCWPDRLPVPHCRYGVSSDRRQPDQGNRDLDEECRISILPDLATAHEQGLKDFEADFWNALFLPKGTPTVIVQRLRVAAVTAMNNPVVRRRMTELGAELAASERQSQEYLQDFVESEIKKWAGPIKASGVSMN